MDHSSLECAARFQILEKRLEILEARYKKQKTKLKEAKGRLRQLEAKQNEDFVSEHPYLKLDPTSFSIKGKSIDRNAALSSLTNCNNKFFRFVARKYWGVEAISNSYADKLPPRFNKVVNAMIISINAFWSFEGVKQRCIGSSQMEKTYKNFRTLFLTMGVEMRTQNKRSSSSSSNASNSSTITAANE